LGHIARTISKRKRKEREGKSHCGKMESNEIESTLCFGHTGLGSSYLHFLYSCDGRDAPPCPAF
jgi:hypothetical protein